MSPGEREWWGRGGGLLSSVSTTSKAFLLFSALEHIR